VAHLLLSERISARFNVVVMLAGTQVGPAASRQCDESAMEEDGGGAGLTLDVDLTRTINFHG
jgi:hypothetical protein